MINVFRVPLGPVRCDDVSRKMLHETFSPLLSSNNCRHIVTLNMYMVNAALKDTELLACINEAACVVADSSGISAAVRFLYGRRIEHIPGIELLDFLCAHADGRSVYLLGAAPGVAEKAARALMDKYPGLRVCGTRDGYFTADQEPGIIEDIRARRPDIILAALGMPRQEMWLYAHRKMLGTPLVMGVGGSFDVIAGNLRRAPRLMQRFSLEWLYRCIQEPQRFIRLIHETARFAFNILRMKLI